MNSGYFEIYPSAGQWRWRLWSANGRIIAVGEAYHNYGDCENAVLIVKTAGRENWNVYEQPVGPYRKTFWIFQDAANEHRWNLYAENGFIVAVASEGYANVAGARNGIAVLKSAWNWPTQKRAA